MEYEWDEAKRQANIAKHGVDFTAATRFEWQSAITIKDQRYAYSEERMQSFGFIGSRLYVLVWTPRRDDVCRVITLRKANQREVDRYECAYAEGRVS